MAAIAAYAADALAAGGRTTWGGIVADSGINQRDVATASQAGWSSTSYSRSADAIAAVAASTARAAIAANIHA